MQRPLWKRIGYTTFKNSLWLFALVFYRFRWKGKEFIPTEGGALVCGNHQSYFDPIFIGICFRRRLNFLARKTLFRSYFSGGLLRYLDAMPIDREGMSLGGVKETLKRLKQGEMVLVFPEGTRSDDGQVGELKPGFIALARRGKVPILPAALDGAYDAWPRTSKLPRLTKVCTVIGPPISTDRIDQMSDQELMDTLRQCLATCQQEAHQMRGAAGRRED